jgi:hypothetical protein
VSANDAGRPPGSPVKRLHDLTANAMRITELDYDAYRRESFAALAKVRDLGGCVIWAAEALQPVLVLEDPTRRRVAVFAYDNPAEREADIALLRAIPDDGGDADSLVPACLRPKPPVRAAGSAVPLEESQ